MAEERKTRPADRPSDYPSNRPSKPPHRRRRGALLAGALVAVLLFAFVRSRRRSSSLEPVAEVPLGSQFGGSIDPGPSSGSFPSFTDLSSARLDLIERSILDLQDQLGTIPPPTDPAGPAEGPAPSSPPVPNDQGASGQIPPAAPGNVRASGPTWTINGQATVLTPAVRDDLVRELRGNGVDPAAWAVAHPAAARAVGIAVPTAATSGPGKAGPTPAGQAGQRGAVKPKPAPAPKPKGSAGGGGTGPRPDPPPRPPAPKPKPKRKGAGGRP